MRDPDSLITRAGVRGDPRRDQHFLVDDRVLDRLPTYVPTGTAGGDAPTTDPLAHVLEIGAGTGALTDRLLATADRVTAIERDPDLVTFLREEFADEIAADRLAIVAGDAVEVDLPPFTASVSNLPYGASSEILFRLLPAGRPSVCTVQAEFAERMAAAPDTPEYGRLSVTARHYADVEIVERVPPEAFDPEPRVESAIVRTTPRAPDYEVPDEEVFLRFVKALFTQRRKTVRNAIRNTAHISGLDDAAAVVAAADEATLGERPDDLAPPAFAALATLAMRVGIDDTEN
ncbi:16S rRNA (adenine(1518)-N(6)/adenine(1519)-N(6))-dimethyltransferase [Halobacteriales archaeon SW_7_68_16]|nr:MAG: 16S rRNA (adenine(1518)-N(6)/adenine(1519)-N(6))-dimethyltransferase [Halobacteriales archaeon SW_7_68_16]